MVHTQSTTHMFTNIRIIQCFRDEICVVVVVVVVGPRSSLAFCIISPHFAPANSFAIPFPLSNTRPPHFHPLAGPADVVARTKRARAEFMHLHFVFYTKGHSVRTSQFFHRCAAHAFTHKHTNIAPPTAPPPPTNHPQSSPPLSGHPQSLCTLWVGVCCAVLALDERARARGA